jgi:hypothetical protein
MANIVIMAIVWSIGAALEEVSRPKFHQFMLDLIAGENIVEVHNIDTIYEFN